MGMIGNSLAQGLISGANIQDGTVDTPDIKDSAVTAAKIASGVVTPAKMDFTGGTANGVLYLNGSKVASSGSALVFDGTNLGVGTSSPATKLQVNGQTRISDGTTNIDIVCASTVGYVGTQTNAPLVLRTNDTERARIDTSGNVGIGNTAMTSFYSGGRQLVVGSGSGSQGLSIYSGASSDSGIYFGRGLTGNDPFQGQLVYSQSIDAMRFFTAANERMRLTTSGSLGIGTSSPVGKVHSKVANDNWGFVTDTNGVNFSGIYFGGTSSYLLLRDSDGKYSGLQNSGTNLIFYANEVERARIDSTGRLGLNYSGGGIWSSDERLTVQAKASGAVTTFKALPGGSQMQIIFVGTTGGLAGYIEVGSTSTTYLTSSDYRLKENIAPMTGALSVVQQLKPCTYTWKADGSDGQGFIAHELAEVCPDAVRGEKDAVREDGEIKPQGIDTSFLVATLTAAIQEQQAIIESLTQRITALETP